MISNMTLAKFLPYLIIATIISGTLFWFHHSGVATGRAEVQEQWDAEKASYKKALDSLQAQYDTLESQVRIDNQRNSDELAEKDKNHAVVVARIERDYEQRLQHSEQRARRYQRQAQGGAVEQANLASHAAELDRALEQGRRLVAELTATLRQRDEQLRAVGQQLLNDRKLLTMDESK